METLRRHRPPGFTLIELLLVIGLIAILAAIVIVAVNPSQQLAKSRNVQRQQDITTILNAFYQYAIEHSGRFQDVSVSIPADCTIPLMPATARKVCLSTVSNTACDFGLPGDGDGCAYSATLAPTYVVGVPNDPQDTRGGADDQQVDYSMVISTTGNRLVVFADNTEVPPAQNTLSVSR